MSENNIEVASAEEMERLGEQKLRELLSEERDSALIIQLIGDLGAGKTTFVRGMARSLGIDAHITSPTFTVHKEYTSKDSKLELHHFDFYRLPDLGIMEGELKELVQDPSNIIVVEWGGILGDLARDAKVIKIERLDDERRVVLA
ncbi:tRNA (adenosine(37)-N6)-threonylcarbamoyltransferase complex ATPase subunit type 1 TsaE [Candidatus Saccharibacteria bacterium]|nr:tRNA (adenosine(37)-N6)-threonylcarbamoyltransferase complex ATPase subunit type 1 TsaE [Candidatus Saccharibacteria bacterium]